MMRLPRPASPKALWADLRAFFAERSKFQWISLGLALLVPAVIGTTFLFDRRDAGNIGPQLIYIESWPANRTMEETVAKQEHDQALRNEAFEARRREFQRISDFNNRIGL